MHTNTSTPLKIAFVLDDSLDKTDGVQQYVTTLGHYYQHVGYEVHYLVGQTARTDIQNIHSLSRNLQVHFNQNRMSTPLPASTKKIKALLEREAYDVIHVQMPYSPLMASKIIKAASPRTAVIGTFHIIPFSGLEKKATRLLGMALKSSRQRFDAVVSVSEPASVFLKQSFKLSSTVIPNVVDVGSFSKGHRLTKYADDKLTIVFLGRLVERKGCSYFLEAIEKLHAQRQLDGARVLICGKGPLQSKLEAYVHQNHLGHIVHFTGYLAEADKPDYLASADIAVFPSTGGESFGIVLIEAMAAGSKVVLGGNNVGYQTVLGERTDQLIELNNPGAFAKQLGHFIHSSQARQKAYRWQKAAVQQYDVHDVGQQLLSLYSNALLKRRANLP